MKFQYLETKAFHFQIFSRDRTGCMYTCVHNSEVKELTVFTGLFKPHSVAVEMTVLGGDSR